LSPLGALPAFILPSPVSVWQRFVQTLLDGSLIHNSLVTLLEVLSGLLIGSLLATLLGYALAKSKTLERILSPFLVASQAIPTVAIAPLLVIWFGPGMISKIIICSLTVFFPILVNTIIGIQAVPESLYDLMKSMRATRVQTLRYLEVPAALPVLFGGLRIGATLSVIGAVVGEFVGSDRGLDSSSMSGGGSLILRWFCRSVHAHLYGGTALFPGLCSRKTGDSLEAGITLQSGWNG